MAQRVNRVMGAGQQYPYKGEREREAQQKSHEVTPKGREPILEEEERTRDLESKRVQLVRGEKRGGDKLHTGRRRFVLRGEAPLATMSMGPIPRGGGFTRLKEFARVLSTLALHMRKRCHCGTRVALFIQGLCPRIRTISRPWIRGGGGGGMILRIQLGIFL